MSGAGVGLAAAFGAGLVSFLSPCVLPLVPAYLSIVSGVEFSEIEEGGSRRRVVAAAVGFVAGFSGVFVLLGATASVVGGVFAAYRGVIARIAGILAVIMGLILIGALRIPALTRERRFDLSASRLGPFAAPLLGAGFAFGWTPCIGPVLASILAYAAAQATVARGALLLGAYAVGLAVPFLATALAFDRLASTWGWFRRHAGVVNAVAGALLIVTGLLLATDRLRLVTAFMLRLAPAAARLG